MAIARKWRSLEYWRQIPLYRLTSLLLAFFCLFGMIGCLIAVIELGRKPLIAVVVWTVFTGLMAVAYLLTLFRWPRWLPAAVVAHYLGSVVLRSLVRHLGGVDSLLPSEGTVRFAGMLSLVLSFAAGLFFLRFFTREGRLAVRMETELALAQAIQKTLVPLIDFRSPALEIYGITEPSEKVGGDLVDTVQLSDGSVLAYVADIAGHGLPAGILMGMVKTAARTLLADPLSPTCLLERLNLVLPQIKSPEAYATAAVFRIHCSGGGFAAEYALAGHPPLFHFSPNNPDVKLLADPQFPVGLLPSAEYRDQRFQFTRGDIVLVVTDGILEALDKFGNEFGAERIQQLLLQNSSRPLSELAAEIFKSVRKDFIQTDDQSLLLARAV